MDHRTRSPIRVTLPPRSGYCRKGEPPLRCVAVRFDPETWERLEMMATRGDVAMSALVRRLVRDALKKADG